MDCDAHAGPRAVVRAHPSTRRDPVLFAGGVSAAIAGGLALTGGLVALTLAHGCESSSFSLYGGPCKVGTEWSRTDHGLQSAGVALLVGGAFLTVMGVTFAIVGGRKVRATELSSAALIRF